MKITVVMGFFLPMPAVAGGAIEKSWHRLAHTMASQGHEVTLVSRQWDKWPQDETLDGVRYLRIKGYDHSEKLWINLLLDFLWSWRVFFHLPTADIVALNTISLAGWLGLLKPRAGKVVAMPGRMPKGQFKLYRKLSRILVPSAPVKEAVKRERPDFAPLIKTIGYPIDFESLSSKDTKSTEPITISYVGRIHREKGVSLLIEAANILARSDSLPGWRIIICGPSEVSQGGSGTEYLSGLQKNAPAMVEFHEAIFEESKLHNIYQQSHLFCYPSLADNGETFGVSVAEAMAAGAVPIVSNLACFRDFLTADVTGLIFDAHAPDAAALLAKHLRNLILNPAKREEMARAGRDSIKPYNFTQYSERLIADFRQLTSPPSSTPSTS